MSPFHHCVPQTSSDTLGAMADTQPYCLFGFVIPDSIIDAKNKDWLERITGAQNTFIVVNGLIFAATFNAINSFDVKTAECGDANCNSGLYFRGLSAAAFCCSATAIVTSAVMITALSIYDPDRAKQVRVKILQLLNCLSQFEGTMSTAAIILTLCAVYFAPLSIPGARVPPGGDKGASMSGNGTNGPTDWVTGGVWAIASVALLSTILLHVLALPCLLGCLGGRRIYTGARTYPPPEAGAPAWTVCGPAICCCFAGGQPATAIAPAPRVLLGPSNTEHVQTPENSTAVPPSVSPRL